MAICSFLFLKFLSEEFMCGIAGCFGAADEKIINRMLDALGHRGPNDRGLHRVKAVPCMPA